MGPARRLAAGLFVVVMATGGFVAGRLLWRPRDTTPQPIAFNHRAHTESLECETCHELVTRSAHSGLPGLSTCLMCHEEAQTDLAEEQKIRDMAATGAEQIFRKLFRLPDNVFYTHRRHVTVAGLECSTCHGEIAETEVPPDRPLVRVTMDFCRNCHELHDVSTDCTRCHR